MRGAGLLALVLVAAGPVRAADVCGPAIVAAERAVGTAPGLLAAIGVVESGRRDGRTGVRTAWPWTVTAGGVGTYYATKAAAISAVQALQAGGTASIDVGCMQVNLMYHPDAFRTLEVAFDPAANALYSARFLRRLWERLGDWKAAAAGYHSLSPERGAQYGRLIAAVWGGAPVPTAVGPGGVELVLFPGGGEMRIMRDAAGPGRVAGYLSGP